MILVERQLPSPVVHLLSPHNPRRFERVRRVGYLKESREPRVPQNLMVDHHNPNIFLRIALKEDTADNPPSFYTNPKHSTWKLLGGPSAGFTPCQLVQAAAQAEKDVLREKEVMQFCCWAVACLERMVSTCFLLFSDVFCILVSVLVQNVFFDGAQCFLEPFDIIFGDGCQDTAVVETHPPRNHQPKTPLTHGFPKGRKKGAGWAFFINDGQPAQRRNSSVYIYIYIYIAHLFAISCIISGVCYMWIFIASDNIMDMWIYLYMIWQ